MFNHVLVERPKLTPHGTPSGFSSQTRA